MNTPEELARFKEEVRQRTRLVLEKVTRTNWIGYPHPSVDDSADGPPHASQRGGVFQIVQHGDWGYSVRRRTAPLVTLLGESEPWETELAAFEETHQDWLTWISHAGRRATQELVNPQNTQRVSALAFVLARIEHEASGADLYLFAYAGRAVAESLRPAAVSEAIEPPRWGE